MNLTADIGIVGGGPVGLATAIMARLRGFEVVVWEPREGAVDKACGEGLMPSALAELTELGVELPRGREFVGIRYIDGLAPSLRAKGAFATPARGVRRTELSDALERRAREVGVRIEARRVRGFEDRGDCVQVDDQRVKWLVGADGLHSMVRRAAGLELEGNSSRFGVRRHYALAPWSDRVEVYWSDVGEAYVTPVGPDSIGVAILFDPPGRFDELLGHFPELEARLAGARATTEDRGAGPFGQRASSVHKGNVFLVGDAAGYVDALTGEGIAIGVASGRALVDCLSAGRPERYPREWSRATRLWRWSTRALLVATRRRAAQRMIIRFLKHIPGLFDFVLRQLGGNAIVAHQTRP